MSSYHVHLEELYSIGVKALCLELELENCSVTQIFFLSCKLEEAINFIKCAF